jgi:hypothetical protein
METQTMFVSGITFQAEEMSVKTQRWKQEELYEAVEGS